MPTATDKQIFELPVITTTILNSGVQIGFVAQVAGYNLDFQVPQNILTAYVSQNIVHDVLGGLNVPDNAIGNNGDIYVKTDGKLYVKAGNVWNYKITLPTYTPPASIPIAYNNGDPNPIVIDISTPTYSSVNNNVGIIYKELQTSGPYNGKFVRYLDYIFVEVSSTVFNIYLHDDGTGHILNSGFVILKP